MNATVNKTVSTVTHNFVGAIAGGVALYFGAKKMGVSNNWAVAGLVIVGVFAGATVQSKIAAKKSAPTAATVTK